MPVRREDDLPATAAAGEVEVTTSDQVWDIVREGILRMKELPIDKRPGAAKDWKKTPGARSLKGVGVIIRPLSKDTLPVLLTTLAAGDENRDPLAVKHTEVEEVSGTIDWLTPSLNGEGVGAHIGVDRPGTLEAPEDTSMVTEQALMNLMQLNPTSDQFEPAVQLEVVPAATPGT